ncbi:MAG: 4Fe-4S binding protein [Candidatus Omnitrophota bacterium]
MAKRQIIKIDEKKCNGCGLCIPNCPEGALQVIDGKARLISDLFCDGLGACIGHCPQGAITIEERQAEEYDERKVMANVVKQGENVIRAHLEHLKSHGQTKYLNEALGFLREKGIEIQPAHAHAHAGGCPGSKMMEFKPRKAKTTKEARVDSLESELSHWPVQIMLVPAYAPYLQDADLLIAADCVPFAYANFHQDLLKGKIVLVGCPKLDDLEAYRKKFSQILEFNNIKSIAYAHMEVPCCFGLVGVIKEAIKGSGKEIPFKEIVISIKGEKLNEL